MLALKIRRILAPILALALTLGATNGLGALNMSLAPATAVANEMPMPSGMPMSGKCDGCARHEKGMVPPACSALCNAALPFAPPIAFVELVCAGAVGPTSDAVVTGRSPPPDPYPPRPIVLS